MAKPTIESKIIQQLDTLGELKLQSAGIDEAIQKLIDDSIPPAIAKKIAALKASKENADDAVTKLETDIKNAILIRGESLKATTLHAIYAKGRETWDSKGLAGYAIVHPEILKLKKTGEPSVSIRAVKAGD
jgi:hypothetical protein